MNALEPDLHVLDLYARLAANRAVDARAALRHSQSADELLAQSAQALEDAAGTLTLASEMYSEDREAFAGLLTQQAAALVVLAAQFEQAADLPSRERMRTMSANEPAFKGAMRRPIPVARFRAPDGSSHTVAVTAVEGGWRILDQNGGEPAVVDTLTHREDGREQAEAVARDYARWAELPTWARS